MKFVAALFVAITLAVPSFCYGASTVHVVDGDTLDVDGVRYRLHGIDAPEAAQKCRLPNGKTWSCGKSAIKMMTALTSGKTLVCDDRGHDDYGRIIAVCRVDGQDINDAMIKAGMAWAFTKYSTDYERTERSAKSQAVGIWQADTQTAWAYRAEKWNVGVQIAPKECPIKGNINRKKQKIYHMPWSRDYAKTKVSLDKGEMWFCSEKEALDAGFRAARNDN